MIYKIMRYVIVLLFTIMGYVATDSLFPVIEEFLNLSQLRWDIFHGPSAELVIAIVGAIVWGLLGLILSNRIFTLGRRITANLEGALSHLSGEDLLFGTIGLAFGLIISNLIGLAFRNIPLIGPYIPVILSAILGYLGMDLMVRKRKDIVKYWQDKRLLPERYLEGKNHKQEGAHVPAVKQMPQGKGTVKLLDTSVVIDGRIGEICHTGFLEGTLVAPTFVLEELQKIADSSDALKRNKGRRGLDILQEMQNDPKVQIVFLDTDYDDITEVDSKLMRLALDNHWKIITNDFNLNKVATLQGIPVLNLNDLANAMKPVRAPGERMQVHVVKEGKENGQGVAYLEDGTMIVIEQGIDFVSETIEVAVTSILQTRAGRMIFARPTSLGGQDE